MVIVPSLASTPSRNIPSFGTIIYPTGQIEEDNLASDLQRWFEGVGTPLIDSTVVHTQGVPSLKIPQGGFDYEPNLFELNNYMIPVNLGDRIIFRAWIKADPANFAPGGYIGFDLYGSDQRLWEISDHMSGNDQTCLQYPKDWNYKFVSFGSDWTQVEVDFIVPNTPFNFNDYGQPRTPSPQYVEGIIPWMSANYRLPDNVVVLECPADMWFADMELYIISEG